jgi:hypothetical protein
MRNPSASPYDTFKAFHGSGCERLEEGRQKVSCVHYYAEMDRFSAAWLRRGNGQIPHEITGSVRNICALNYS